ncbi:hypothetical protein [Dictyobacter kobayashii]|uniref:Uncharacterized protein n=1 Tax=Dictyobacter kobayashii TaxID=2014872 RepID=A0A402AIS8_9CHLR|nr:hypothetical protein [Dictyobacter kobayashii]GCE18964.1 hypothetical protein KDK_27640 [Dictyobacter kobayashii]
MGTTPNIQQQIKKIKEQLQPNEAIKQTIDWDLSLFTPDEQVQLQALLAIVEPKYRWVETGEYAGKIILRDLSDDELDQLSRWDTLQVERKNKQA